jgi:simple sugar transport system ATP-binding protein
VSVLEARGICKNYGHVEVLREVDFEAEAGEVTALIGDNGAGKSTLVKILSGAVTFDRGTIRLDGDEVELGSPTRARDLGIETVYQDLALAPELGPAENTFAGRELLKPGILGRLGVLDRKAMRDQAGDAFTRMGTDPRTRVYVERRRAEGKTKKRAEQKAAQQAFERLQLEAKGSAVDGSSPSAESSRQA